MRVSSLLCCCLVVLAGCSVGQAPTTPVPETSDPPEQPTATQRSPESTPGPLQLNVTNGASSSYTFTVGVVNRSVDRVRLTFENGSTRTVEVPVDGIARVYGYDNLTKAVPVGGQEIVRTYQLTPRSGARADIAPPPVGGAVFLTAVGADGSVDHFAVLTCDRGERLRAVDFFTTQQGVGAGVGCSR
ncbi:hypothetical protein [Halorarius litoreus]|uniref:hypothetical protein n=1 Tax=Halorarius litoreus TaxID=2962676 RepID=UPI0020CD80C9|nr:hypothetical protein [Halorarius litoreus]